MEQEPAAIESYTELADSDIEYVGQQHEPESMSQLPLAASRAAGEQEAAETWRCAAAVRPQNACQPQQQQRSSSGSDSDGTN